MDKSKLIAEKLAEWLDKHNVSKEDVIKSLQEEKPAQPRTSPISEKETEELLKTVNAAIKTKRSSLVIAAFEDDDGGLEACSVYAKGTAVDILTLSQISTKSLMKKINIPLKIYKEGLDYLK